MGRNPQDAGMNGTSPEIPYTVEADPYPTGGKAAAAARPGQSGPASTGAPAVGTQGREAHGTRETPAPPRPPVGGAACKGDQSGGVQRWGVGSAHGTQGTGGKPRGGKGPTDQRVGAAAHGGHSEAHPHVPVAAPARPHGAGRPPGAVHLHRSPDDRGGLLCRVAASGQGRQRRRGWGDGQGLRREPGREPPGSARAGQGAALPPAAGAPGLQPEGGRHAASPRGARPRGPTGPGGGPARAGPDLRAGVSALLARVPPGAQPAPGARHPAAGDHSADGEPRAGHRHPGLLRHHGPRALAALCSAPGEGSEHPSAAPPRVARRGTWRRG